MPGAFLTSDLAGFFVESEFADSATFTHEGSSSTISVIFDAPVSAHNIATGVVEMTAPVAWTVSSAVTGAAHGDTLVVNGTTYYVTGVETSEDGEVTRLSLSEDCP